MLNTSTHCMRKIRLFKFLSPSESLTYIHKMKFRLTSHGASYNQNKKILNDNNSKQQQQEHPTPSQKKEKKSISEEELLMSWYV